VAWATQTACVGALTAGLLVGDCGDANDVSIFADACSRPRSPDGTDGVPSFSDSPGSVAPRATAYPERTASRQAIVHTAALCRNARSPLAIAPKQGPPR
jgi:hypothetical protein